MKVKTMRLVDKWLGVPLCLALTAWRRLTDRRKPAGRPTRIAFFKLAEQGSTVLAAPAIMRAIEMVGRDNVFFVVFESNRHILDAMGLIDSKNVIAIPDHCPLATARGAIRSIRRLRELKVDAAVDLEFFARSTAILAYLSGAATRSGLGNSPGAPWRGDLFTNRVSFDPRAHTTEIFGTLVEALLPGPVGAWASKFPLPSFTPTADEISMVRGLLPAAAAKLVLLNSNAGDLLPLRRWSDARYVELARRLLKEHPNVWIAFTGSPSEARAAGDLAAQVADPRCFSLAGKTDMRQLLTLYTLCDCLVTNDSGPAHFAALTPIGTVTLFGPETPRLFAAQTPRNRVLTAQLACSPCVTAYNNRLSRCCDNICMQKITVDEVFQAVAEALDIDE